MDWHYVHLIDAVTTIRRTYLYAQRLKDSGGTSDGELQFFNQSLHLFNLHLCVINVGIIVGIRVLLHFFNFYCQLYYLFCVRCQLGLIVFQLRVNVETFYTFLSEIIILYAHASNMPEYLSHLQLQFV